MQEWLGNDLEPEEYGWELPEGEYRPVMGYTEVCPPAVLMMLSCKCKTDCNSKTCGCRKLGLKCTDLCQCSDNCVNHGVVADENDENSEENIDVEELDEFDIIY